MDAFRAWFAQLDLDRLWMLLVTGLSCLVCITLHELCHGLAALALGDPTAKQAGRLSLNPMKHIDLMGLVMMALLRFGWAKPVPVNAGYFRNPKRGMAITALAGPACNIVLSGLALMGYAVAEFYYLYLESEILYYVSVFCLYTASLSAGLAVFNLIPIPPLDGSKILSAILPDRAWLWLMKYERYSNFLLMGLLLLGVLDGPLTVLREGLLEGLSQICLWPFDVLVSLYFGEIL